MTLSACARVHVMYIIMYWNDKMSFAKYFHPSRGHIVVKSQYGKFFVTISLLHSVSCWEKSFWPDKINSIGQ